MRKKTLIKQEIIDSIGCVAAFILVFIFIILLSVILNG